MLAQQIETAARLGEPVAVPLTGQLICYGRSVVNIEWPRATEGTLGDQINPWGVELFETVQPAQLNTRRPARPPTASGSTRHPTARRRATTASTAPSA